MNITANSNFALSVSMLSTLYIVGCSSIIETNVSDNNSELESYVGWLHGNCFAVRNSNIVNSTNMLVVRLDNAQEVLYSKIVSKVGSGDECYPLLEDRRAINIENGLSYYIVRSEEPIDLGIGIVDKDNTPAKNYELLDLDGDGRKDTFSQCLTSEGIRFSVWNGVAYKSNLIWSDYYYLGYDAEPNCPLLPNQ